MAPLGEKTQFDTSSWWSNPQRQLNPARGNLWTLVWELWSLHGTSLWAWNVWGASRKGPGSIASTWAGLLALILYEGIPCSDLTQGEGTSSCLNLMCQTVDIFLISKNKVLIDIPEDMRVQRGRGHIDAVWPKRHLWGAVDGLKVKSIISFCRGIGYVLRTHSFPSIHTMQLR